MLVHVDGTSIIKQRLHLVHVFCAADENCYVRQAGYAELYEAGAQRQLLRLDHIVARIVLLNKITILIHFCKSFQIFIAKSLRVHVGFEHHVVAHSTTHGAVY